MTDYISIKREVLGKDVNGNESFEFEIQSKSNVAIIITINNKIIFVSFNNVLQDTTKYKDFNDAMLVFVKFIDS